MPILWPREKGPQSLATQPSLKMVRDATDSAHLDVVFVHGLNGHSVTSWRFNEEPNWAVWLGRDLPSARIWTLGYEVAAIAWQGHAMPLSDRAINILALLQGHNFGQFPIVFVAHSMGGLLAKQLLRSASEIATDYLPIMRKCRAIAFLSTPHTGSSIADLAQYLSIFLRSTVAIDELKYHDARLRELNQWYRNHAEPLGIATKVLFETRMTYSILDKGVMVVTPSSSDPGMIGVTPVPVDHDHFSIACPNDQTDVVYLQVKSLIEMISRNETDDNQQNKTLATTKEPRESISKINVIEGDVGASSSITQIYNGNKSA